MAGAISSLTQQALGSYATYAAYVAQELKAQPVGTVDQIPNDLKSVLADVTVLTDPVRLEAFKASIANQMNRQSGGPVIEDLSSRIADVQLQTTAQGAGTLTITIIDPLWLLLSYDWPRGSGNTFIQADATGYLWPPIDINFPEGTDCVWRLCQCAPTTDYTAANLTLTFEDRTVSWLREVNGKLGGVWQASPDATLAGFLHELVNGANRYLRGHPAASGGDWHPIRLVQLVSPKDPNYAPPVGAPSSSTSTQSPLSRQNPNKVKTGFTKAQQEYIDRAGKAVPDFGGTLNMVSAEQATALAQTEVAIGWAGR